MVKIVSNGLSLEVEDHGNPNNPPVLFIAGLGSQLISWSQAWIDRFVRAGFRVIVFDNRDVGLSDKLDNAGVPNISTLKAKQIVDHRDVPYTIDDMADDAVGVLDALGISAAHVVGRSMGGMILQAMLRRHPNKILDAAFLVTSSGAVGLPPMTQEADAHIYSDGVEPIERQAAIEATLLADRVWASPKYPFDPDVRRAEITRSFDRCHHPDGTARQTAAMLQFLGAESPVASFNLPALVVQGMADTIFLPAHGRDLAGRINGAKLLEIDGMGHDLEGEAECIVAKATLDLFTNSQLT